MMKRIGVLFGMENTFPGRSSSASTASRSPDVTAEFVQMGGVRMAEPSRYAVIVDRISHDVPFYRAYLKNAALDGTYIINNPFWWSADDKFFNYALADAARRRHPADGHPAAQGASGGHHRPVDAQPALPARLGRGLRLRRLPGLPQAVRRRRLARRPQGQLARGVLRRLRPDAHAVHDAADGGELQRVLPLLRRRPGESAHHALRPAGAVSRALREEPAGLRPRRCSSAWSTTRARCAGRSATTSTRWNSRSRTAFPTPSTS